MPTPPSSASGEAPRLTVYENRFCGYCMDVRQVIAELGLDVAIRSIADHPIYRGELIRATGRTTVPVLKIENADGTVRWLPESRDIIAYLYSRAGVRPPRMRLRRYGLVRIGLVLGLLLLWAVTTRGAAWF